MAYVFELMLNRLRDAMDTVFIFFVIFVSPYAFDAPKRD